jgi:DNA-binding GntR family transcriptional regulator
MSPSSAEQTTTAVLADAFTARHLGVEPASALLCIHRLVRDDSNRSIEHQSHVFRPDRSHLYARVAIERSPAGLRWSETQSPRLPAAL